MNIQYNRFHTNYISIKLNQSLKIMYTPYLYGECYGLILLIVKFVNKKLHSLI